MKKTNETKETISDILFLAFLSSIICMAFLIVLGGVMFLFSQEETIPISVLVTDVDGFREIKEFSISKNSRGIVGQIDFKKTSFSLIPLK